MRVLLAMVLMVTLAGCATLGDVLDILAPDEPVPVCEAGTAGVTVDGRQCIKYSDGSYRWR